MTIIMTTSAVTRLPSAQRECGPAVQVVPSSECWCHICHLCDTLDGIRQCICLISCLTVFSNLVCVPF